MPNYFPEPSSEAMILLCFVIMDLWRNLLRKEKDRETKGHAKEISCLQLSTVSNNVYVLILLMLHFLKKLLCIILIKKIKARSMTYIYQK